MTTTTTTFAELAVEFGCNVRPGQILTITAEVGSEETVRAIADAAYRRGAAYVDVLYEDAFVDRSRLRDAAPETLDLVPSWRLARARDLGTERQAFLTLTASREPAFFAGIDPADIGRISMAADFAAMLEAIGARLTNWSLMPLASQAWAELVHPDLSPEAALDELTRQLVYVCRLDADDPVGAWRERIEALTEVADRLTGERFDALRFTGPRTDLTIGLLPTSTFTPTYLQTVDGIRHMANLPSEEILAAPDPMRAEGVVRATMPLYFGGVVIEDLEVEFTAGRAVRIDGSADVEALRSAVARHENGDRLGEVALVDGDGRIGELGTIFYNTLLDENASSHIALGNAYPFSAGAEDGSRINRSDMHVDFMIGGPDVTVTGVAADGGEVPVLEAGAWRL